VSHQGFRATPALARRHENIKAVDSDVKNMKKVLYDLFVHRTAWQQVIGVKLTPIPWIPVSQQPAQRRDMRDAYVHEASSINPWFEEDTVAASLGNKISEKVRQHPDGYLPVA